MTTKLSRSTTRASATKLTHTTQGLNETDKGNRPKWVIMII